VTASTTRTPRHRHSPRVRRRARDRGIDLDTVLGTGPGGRVTEADLVRRPAAPASVVSVVAGAVAARQVELRAAPDRDRLVALAAAAGLHALRRRSVPAAGVTVTRDGMTRVVAGAHDLTVDALQLRLGWAPAAADATALRILDAPEVDLQTGVPRPGETAVIALGAVLERVVVERGAGTLSFAARPTVTVSVAAAPDVPEAVSAEILRHVADRLAAS